MQTKKSQKTPRTTAGRLFSSKLTLQACPSRWNSEERQEQQQPRKNQVAGPLHNGTQGSVALPQQKQQKTGQSVRVPYVNSLSLDKMFEVVVTVVQ
jgi:hypothetical protein